MQNREKEMGGRKAQQSTTQERSKGRKGEGGVFSEAGVDGDWRWWQGGGEEAANGEGRRGGGRGRSSGGRGMRGKKQR